MYLTYHQYQAIKHTHPYLKLLFREINEKIEILELEKNIMKFLFYELHMASYSNNILRKNTNIIFKKLNVH